MFIDEIQFFAQAGRGGDGVVRWRREKFIDKGGPNGGDGGRGGSVFAIAVQDIHLLSKYKHKKSFKADRGDDGAGGSRHGKDGKDLIIELPVAAILMAERLGGVGVQRGTRSDRRAKAPWLEEIGEEARVGS